jgi:hypothetical protein
VSSPSPVPTASPPPPATLSASPTRASDLPLPPPGSRYLGVYPGGVTGEEDDLTAKDLAAFEASVGKTAAWVYFSNNWYRSRAFPVATASWIRAGGSVPFVRLMLRSDPEQDHAEPAFNVTAILAGTFDRDLRTWCTAARDFGTPVLAEYGTEVNGSWFSWNGTWSGGGTTDGYGDPAVADGPERFRDAYRRIIGICRDAGAANVHWVFHVNGGDDPAEPWNRFENYNPGPEWIDWIGVSIYGALTPLDEEAPVFRDDMDAIYPRLVALAEDGAKPIALLEFGVAKGNPRVDQAAWARAALRDIVGGRWPAFIGFSWWNERWQNDDTPAHDTTMRVQDNPKLAAVFRELVGASPTVLGRIAP